MPVTEDAIDRLKDMIRSGAVRPGDRLPREGDLAEQLGVSRNSLRESVRALSLLRILDVRQGDGTYVTELAADTLLAALSFVVDFHGDATLLEVVQVRRILEPAATALAATRIDEPTLAQLADLVERTSTSSTVQELVEVDMRFHRLIATLSGNAALAAMLESLSGPTTRMRVWRGATQEDVVARTIAEHRAIVDALRRRDPELARALATVHVAWVEEWIRLTLDSDQVARAATEPHHDLPDESTR